MFNFIFFFYFLSLRLDSHRVPRRVGLHYLVLSIVANELIFLQRHRKKGSHYFRVLYSTEHWAVWLFAFIARCITGVFVSRFQSVVATAPQKTSLSHRPSALLKAASVFRRICSPLSSKTFCWLY